MAPRYPTAFSQVSGWASSAGTTIAEARLRFAQFAVLAGVPSVADLRESLVLKGGNALDLGLPNRSTIDLDFSFDPASTPFEPAETTLRALLSQGLRVATSRYGVAFAVNSVRQQPPGSNRAFATFACRIGYGLPDESRLLLRMAGGQPSPHVVPMDLSLNEPIGASVHIEIDPSLPRIRVCTIEDIVGEKLRSLLQQPIRGRHRRQDVLDIAILLETHPRMDRSQVAAFLELKAAARSVPVSRAAFRDPAVIQRAALDYEALAATTRTRFVPFPAAIAAILRLVEELPIPED
jgi:predicted nucleotidyltransferase component of viral defense system